MLTKFPQEVMVFFFHCVSQGKQSAFVAPVPSGVTLAGTEDEDCLRRLTVCHQIGFYFKLVLLISFCFKAMDDERTDTPRVKSFG